MSERIASTLNADDLGRTLVYKGDNGFAVQGKLLSLRIDHRGERVRAVGGGSGRVIPSSSSVSVELEGPISTIDLPADATVIVS